MLADYTGPLKLPTGYKCSCGRTHRFPFYVYAQTAVDNVRHDCDCGRKNLVLRGSLRVEHFVKVVSPEKLNEWAEEWDDEKNLNRIWLWVRDDMARGVTDADTYRSVRPEIAARYGLPGSHAKLHSGRRYDKEHKYRAGAWDHVPMFDVKWEFAGRQGKHLCLASFEGSSLRFSADDFADAMRNRGEDFSNAWCQKLLAFIHECDLMFARTSIKQEFEYQVANHAAEELHEVYEKAVADAKEKAEATYWAERDVLTTP